MKIFKYIPYVICIIMLMTSCKEELDEFTIGKISLTATIDGDHPSYEVSYSNCDASDILEIGICEKFIDNHWDRNGQRTIELTPNTLSCNKKYWTAYEGDGFEAYAYMKTKNGKYRTESVKIHIPEINTPHIKSVNFNYTGQGYGQLTILGENFPQKGIYETKEYTSASDLQISENKIYIEKFPIKKTGTINTYLSINNIKHSFSFNVDSPKIINISRQNITAGDTINIQVEGFVGKLVSWFTIDNCDIIEVRQNGFVVIPQNNETGKVDITVREPWAEFFCTQSVPVNVVSPKWTKTIESDYRDQKTYLYGNRLYTYSDNAFHVYDCNSGKKIKTYKWKAIDFGIDNIYVDDKYIYVSYETESSDQVVIDKINLETSKYETITGIVNYPYQIWTEGTKIRVSFGNSYKYGFDNKSYTSGTFSSDSKDFRFLAIDNNYVYGIMDHQICRYKCNNISKIEKLGEPVFADEYFYNLIGVIDGWIYYNKLISYKHSYVYKTKCSSLNSRKPETISLGNTFTAGINGIDRGQITTDGSNIYILTNGAVIKTPMK